VVFEAPFVVDCCGALKKWVFSIGDNGDIELQVWRPARGGSKKFQLVGYNKYTVLSECLFLK